MQKTLKMGFEIHRAEEWDELERLAAARLVMAYMASAPKFGKRKRAIVAKLLDGDCDRHRDHVAHSPTIAERIRGYIERHRKVMVHYAPPDTQRRRFFFDHDLKGRKPSQREKGKHSYGQHSRAVFTAGAMALTLAWSEKLGMPLNLTQAKEFLASRPSSYAGLPVVKTASTIDDHWEEKRDVAHLCTALILCTEESHSGLLPSLKRKRFTEIEEQVLIDDLPRFLGYSQAIWDVLVKVKNASKHSVELNPRRLPDEWAIDPLPIPEHLAPKNLGPELKSFAAGLAARRRKRS